MIPFIRIKFNEATEQAVLSTIKTGMTATGKQVQEFEQAFADYCRVPYAIATSNGTIALDLIWKTIDLKSDNKVITTPFTFIASSNSILLNHANPLFSDINPDTFLLDANRVEDQLKKEKNIRAILLVHLFGLACEMDDFLYLKKKYNVLLIEDCAQAHGAEYKGQKVGSFGDAASFSFYATKNLACAEGGMVFFQDEAMHKKALKICNHGRSSQYEHDLLGHNFRFNNILASVGIEQLKLLDENNTRRKKNAEYYDQHLIPYVQIPHYDRNKLKHVFHLYTIKTEKRDQLKEYLDNLQIQTGIVYPIPNYRQPYYSNHVVGLENMYLKNTENACEEVLSLPIYPDLDQKELKIVVDAITSFYNAHD